MDFDDFLIWVAEGVSDELSCDYSDAEAIVMARGDVIYELFKKRMTPGEVTSFICSGG